MATIWSILAFLAATASALSFAMTMYPVGPGRGGVRAVSSVVMIGFGVLTLVALQFARGTP